MDNRKLHPSLFPRNVAEDIELAVLEQEHAAAFLELVQRDRAYLRAWVPWVDRRQSLANVNQYFHWVEERIRDDLGFCVGIFYKGSLVGEMKAHTIDWLARSAIVGYWIASDHQGKGIVTRATRSLVDLLIKELDIKRVEMTCATGNARSYKIPERLGFTREGTLRQAECLYGETWHDVYMYSVLDSEWS